MSFSSGSDQLRLSNLPTYVTYGDKWEVQTGSRHPVAAASPDCLGNAGEHSILGFMTLTVMPGAGSPDA